LERVTNVVPFDAPSALDFAILAFPGHIDRFAPRRCAALIFARRTAARSRKTKGLPMGFASREGEALGG